MTYWKSQPFKALQRAWYAKLREHGFDDAEEMVADEMRLKQSATFPYRHVDELGITTKETYYSLLSQYVQESVFQNDIDHLIMSMFAEGSKIKRIVEALEKRGEARCRGTVRYTIRKYEMKWGMKDYSPKQLNKKVPRTA